MSKSKKSSQPMQAVESTMIGKSIMVNSTKRHTTITMLGPKGALSVVIPKAEAKKAFKSLSQSR